MMAAHPPTLRELVEDFLFQEAAMLDEWRLDDWVKLFTEDARYVVPTTDLPEGDPKRDLVFINDDITRLHARVARLTSRHAHREYPWSRTRRFVSNVRVEEINDYELSVAVPGTFPWAIGGEKCGIDGQATRTPTLLEIVNTSRKTANTMRAGCLRGTSTLAGASIFSGNWAENLAH